MLSFLFPHRLQLKINRWLLIGISLFLLSLMQVANLNQALTTQGRQLVQPLLKIEVRVATSLYQLVDSFQRWRTTARRIQDLEIKLATALAQLSELEQVKQENQRLRELLNSSDRSLKPTTLTSPILSLSQPAAGLPQEAKVREGAAVLVQGTLVGLVAETRLNIAYINLLWQESAQPVLAETQTGVQGIVAGDGKNVLLTEVSIEQEIQVGQRVVSSGQEGVDKGLYIGEISAIKSGQSAAVKTAIIQQYVSFYEATVVEIR